MNPSQTSHPWKPWIQLFRERWKVWVPVAVVCFAAATAFAWLKPDTWQASQSLLLRDEAAGQLSTQGRFDNIDAMKAAQEMIAEVARNQVVLTETLKAIGPEKPGQTGEFPALRDIESLRKEVALSPPNGSEFGTTEVLHLTVNAKSRERAVQLTKLLEKQIDASLKDIRFRRADSVIRELENAETLAQEDLRAATQRLKTEEVKVGSDLGELRSLNDATSGDGNLRNSWNQIRGQIRDSEAELVRLEEQLKILSVAKDNPDHLIATPNQLLQSQPALRRLKDGLVDAQLRTSELMGRMSTNHPQVQSAMESEKEVRQNLRNELELAIRGIEADVQVQQTRMQSIRRQELEVKTRLDNLATIRAGYANLVADVEKCNLVLREAHEQLADARANRKASEETSLITWIDEPTTGEYPLGPSRKAIAGVGLIGGCLLGMGLVVLIFPLPGSQGRRWSDRLFGRRSTDQSSSNNGAGDRRAGARNATVQAGNQGRREADGPAVESQPGEERRGKGDRRGRRESDQPATESNPSAVQSN